MAMKKLLLLALLLLASGAYAQEVCINPSGNKIPLKCDATGALTVGGVIPTDNATFAPLDVTLPAGISAAYASAVDLPDGTKKILLNNLTNGDVVVSMDGGTSDYVTMKAFDSLSISLAEAGLVTTAVIAVKDGTTAATAGTFEISSIK